jgi:hypothetical protein
MPKVLMRTTEIWRADTETEAQEIISDALATGGELTKKTIEIKQRKAKGQIIDENLKVTTQIDYAGQWPLEGDDE